METGAISYYLMNHIKMVLCHFSLNCMSIIPPHTHTHTIIFSNISQFWYRPIDSLTLKGSRILFLISRNGPTYIIRDPRLHIRD